MAQAELAEVIQVWRKHRNAVTPEENQAAKLEILELLEAVIAYNN